MSTIKTPQDIAIMTEGGKKLGRILTKLLESAVPGISLLTLEQMAQEGIRKAGGTPSFATVKEYQWATCLCVNAQVVHAIPTPYKLVEGDVLTIDIGMLYRGFHTDTAWTKIVTRKKNMNGTYEKIQRFLDTGVETLWETIHAARPENHIGDLSRTIQQHIQHAGYNVVGSLTGHAIGRKLHEEPMIPEFINVHPEKTPVLQSGMTLAIEIIYSMGSGEIQYKGDDGWTMESRDKSITAVFEHTIAIKDMETIVLTQA